MKRIVLSLLVALFVVTLSAQTPDPSTLPRLTSSSLEYVGSFRTPPGPNGDSFAYGGQGVAYDPATNTLFVGNRNYVGEIAIPTPVKSTDLTQLPVATLLQSEQEPTEGHLLEVGHDVKTYSFLPVGDRLIGSAYIYFDAMNVARVSHYSRSRNLSTPSFSGWSQVWEPGNSGLVGGFMSLVPQEWQVKLGGPAITGQCCIPINYRTSSGPAAFAFDPAKIGQPTVPAQELLYYPQGFPTLGSWSDPGPNPIYNQGTEILAVIVVAGTRTALYIGKTGMDKTCYGPGTGDKALVGTVPSYGGEPYCYDPTNPYKGSHAYPYGAYVWAYDLNDFSAVKAGTKRPWEVVPYATWPLALPIDDNQAGMVGGVGYDAQRQLLYLAQMRADTALAKPVLHVYKISAAATPPTTTDPTIAELQAQVAGLTRQVQQLELSLQGMAAERDAARVAREAEAGRIVTIKALVQKALDARRPNTANAIVVPLQEAMKK